jgi:Transposase IS4
MKWRDKRDVAILSKQHDDQMIDTRKAIKQKEPILTPAVVLCYNQTKQGINVSDQLSSYHSPVRKSIRSYHKVVIELLLGTAVVNAMLL